MAQSLANRAFQRCSPRLAAALGPRRSHSPVRRWSGIETLPVDAGDQPSPLACRQRAHRGVGAGPGEMTLMQAALAKPDTGAIPDQQLEPVAPTVAEPVGTAVAGTAAERRLDPLRKSIDSGAHVDRLDDQPDLGQI